MNTRNLSLSEVSYILSSVYHSDLIDDNNIRSLLEKVLIPKKQSSDAIERLIDTIVKGKVKTTMQVGVAIGQSLGQPITQMALSSFKKTGTSEFDAPDTTSQLRSLLRWTEFNPNAVTTIKVNEVMPSDIRSMKIYSKSIVSLKISSLIRNSEITKKGLRITTDNDLRFKFRLTMTRIAESIHNKTGLTTTVRSEIFGVMDIESRHRVEAEAEEQRDMLNRMMYFDQPKDRSSDTAKDIDKETFDKICDVKVCGIDGISEAIISGDKMIAIGPRFGDIMSMNFVDEKETISHDVWEVYRTLGIEATRLMLVERIHTLANIPSDPPDKNVCLLVDHMCSRGYPLRVDKRGLKNTNAGFLRTLSFESGINTLRRTIAMNSDNIRDPSSKIIVGKPLSR